MKQLLMIAYYFPPLGGAGVQRSAKFAKYLARAGWSVRVITIVPPSFELLDPSGNTDVEYPGIEVQRVEYRETFRDLDRFPGGWRLRSWCQDWLLFPDRMATWLQPALNKAIEICNDCRDLVLYTTSAPYTAHLIGWHLKQRFNLPWIADFRDEWSQNPYISLPARVRLSKHRKAEAQVLNNADIILTVTENICAGLRQLAPQSKALFTVIPNGFDLEDFNGLVSRKNNLYTITHVGTLNDARFKLLRPLFNGLSNLISTEKLPMDTIRLKLVGYGNYSKISEYLSANVSECNWLETVPYSPHHQALQLMADSDLLVVAESNPAAFTGKIFEYLALKKPVLGFLHPESPAANLIYKSKAGWVIGPEVQQNQEKITRILLDGYHAKQKNIKICSPDEEVISLYNRKNQAEKLAQLMDSISSK